MLCRMVCGRNAHGDERGNDQELNQQDGCGLKFSYNGAAAYEANVTHPHLLVMPEVLQVCRHFADTHSAFDRVGAPFRRGGMFGRMISLAE